MKRGVLSFEQTAGLEFLKMSSPFFQSFNDPSETNLNEFVNCFSSALHYCGVGELHYRALERNQLGSKSKPRLEYLNQEASKSNQLGIKTLQQGLTYLSKFVSENKFSTPKQKINLNDLKEECIAFFENLEVKPEDTKKLVNVLNEAIEASSKNPKDLFVFMEGKVNELIKVRESKSRGAEENIAWWKIVAIAVLIGLAAWVVWRCLVKGKNCSLVSANGAKLGYNIASLIIKFC